jgi:hypothetical protein
MFNDYKSEEIRESYVQGTHYLLLGHISIDIQLAGTLYINNQPLLWRKKNY